MVCGTENQHIPRLKLSFAATMPTYLGFACGYIRENIYIITKICYNSTVLAFVDHKYMNIYGSVFSNQCRFPNYHLNKDKMEGGFMWAFFQSLKNRFL